MPYKCLEAFRKWSYHLVSNGIHIANALILFWLLFAFTRKKLLALIASLFILIHPLQTEAVTYVSGRGDPLSVLLMLLSLMSFLVVRGYWPVSTASSRGEPTAPGPMKSTHAVLWWTASITFFILALLSRETAFVYPGYIVVFLVAFVRKERFWSAMWRSIKETWLFFAIAIGYGIVRLTVLNFDNILNFSSQVNPYTEHLSYRLYTFFHVILVYFRITAVPTGLHMERDVFISTSFWNWPVWLGFCVILGLVAFITWLYYRKRAHFNMWFFAWGFFFINLFPTSGITPINALLYEHWLYFSLFGIAALCGFYFDIFWRGLSRVHKAAPWVFAGLAVLYGAFYSVQTIRRNYIWGDTIRLYSDILRYEPSNVRVLNNIANEYDALGDSVKEEYYRRAAIEADPARAEPYYNLGLLMEQKGDIPSALMLYAKAVTADPNFIFGYMRLAQIYAEQGNFKESIKALTKLIEIDSTNPEYLYNRASVYFALEQYDASRADVTEAQRYIESASPQIVQLLSRLAQSLSKIKK